MCVLRWRCFSHYIFESVFFNNIEQGNLDRISQWGWHCAITSKTFSWTWTLYTNAADSVSQLNVTLLLSNVIIFPYFIILFLIICAPCRATHLFFIQPAVLFPPRSLILYMFLCTHHTLAGHRWAHTKHPALLSHKSIGMCMSCSKGDSKAMFGLDESVWAAVFRWLLSQSIVPLNSCCFGWFRTDGIYMWVCSAALCAGGRMCLCDRVGEREWRKDRGALTKGERRYVWDIWYP